MTIGERITQLRKTLKMNQSEFAESLKLTQSIISAYERGTRYPADITIQTICLTHNVSEDWLRDGEGEMFGHLDEISEAAEAAAWMLDAGTPDFIRIGVEELKKLDEENPEALRALETFLRAIVSRLPPEDEQK